jgi:hypothetical protein
MIHIDVSRVPDDKQTHPDFLRLKTQMETALSQQKWINAFCIHEAGHMIYLMQIGVTEYAHLGPRIEYNKQQDTFDGFMASVQPQSKPNMENIDPAALLTTAAKAYAAGGVFAKQLTGSPDQGDQQDRENLDNLCSALEQKYHISLDRDGSWKQAQEDVLKDLRSPTFRAEAWKKARELQNIFGF